MSVTACLTNQSLCVNVVVTHHIPYQVNNQQVSCFLTAGNIKFMLLHAGRSEEAIRNFFQDVYELYVKVRRFVG